MPWDWVTLFINVKRQRSIFNLNYRTEDVLLYDIYTRIIYGYTNIKNTEQELSKCVESKRVLDQINNSLIVIEGFYGGIDYISRIANDPKFRPVEPMKGNMEEYMKCQAIDITNLLQIIVLNGTLKINKDFHKHYKLLNPSLNDFSKKAIYLKIQYLGIEKSLVICLNTDTPITIPRDLP